MDTLVYAPIVFTVHRSTTFDQWLRGLQDRRAVAVVSQRLERVAQGKLGDVRSVGDGVSEMRIHYGPGYRLYLLRDGAAVVVLLCGGDKDSQRRDIANAKRLAKEWEG